MLFNSFSFIFAFLPVTLIVYLLLSVYTEKKQSLIWLLIASLFFYGWWNPSYLLLITSSIAINFVFSKLIGKQIEARKVLFIGVVFNLGLLGYFKYRNFFVENINYLFDGFFPYSQTILPLAISFFTFQQIAFLVDTYNQKTYDHGFLKYSLFILFFPQLIAGPIVRHQELIDQFDVNPINQDLYEKLAKGIAFFSIGLIKKVIFSGRLAEISDPLFLAANTQVLSFYEAWLAALAYTFQIYFDFSGYSDMAIGLALMFGFSIPNNFDTPYRSYSIRDFWRKWHMTLSSFLRDYLYIPMGGNRHGLFKQAIALFITMLLGGLWHGASWNFIAWGGLHGCALWLNQLSHRLSIHPPKLLGWSITFLFVLFCWVLFRAETFSTAMNVYYGLFGYNGVGDIPKSWSKIGIIALAAAFAIIGPSSYVWVHTHLKPNKATAILLAVLTLAVLLELGDIGNNEFIYFQF